MRAGRKLDEATPTSGVKRLWDQGIALARDPVKLGERDSGADRVLSRSRCGTNWGTERLPIKNLL